MAEQFLNRAEVGSVIEQVGSEAVAQFVRGDAQGDAGGPQVLFENGGHRLWRNAPPHLAQKERSAVHTRLVPVALQRRHGMGTKQAEAFLAALPADADDPAHGIDVLGIEIDQFLAAETAAVECFEDGGIACRTPCGGLLILRQGQRQSQQFLELCEREDDRKLPFCLRHAHILEWVDSQPMAALEEPEETPECAEMEPHGRPARLRLHHPEHPAPQVIGGHFAPRPEAWPLPPEPAEGMRIIDQRAWRRIPFCRQKIKKCFLQRIRRGIRGRGRSRGAGGEG